MLLPDMTVIPDADAAELLQRLKDEWLARQYTYNVGGSDTSWRNAKVVTYQACGFLFGPVTIPPRVDAEDGSGVSSMPPRQAPPPLPDLAQPMGPK